MFLSDRSAFYSCTTWPDAYRQHRPGWQNFLSSLASTFFGCVACASKKKKNTTKQQKKARNFWTLDFGFWNMGVFQERNFNPTQDAMHQTDPREGNGKGWKFEILKLGFSDDWKGLLGEIKLREKETFYYFRRSNPVYLTHRLRYRLSTQLVMRSRTLYYIYVPVREYVLCICMRVCTFCLGRGIGSFFRIGILALLKI